MTQVRCYWNLHARCWSIQDAKTRRVIGHATRVLLRDVAFKVSEAGRQRVLREGRKNVHAFAVGELSAADWMETLRGPMPWITGDIHYQKHAKEKGRLVSYNPRRAGTFMVQVGYPEAPGQAVREPIHEAPMAWLGGYAAGFAIVIAFDPCLMTEAESEKATV
jgi:hypothetical protein